MAPISRRTFLAGSVTIALAACASDGDGASPTEPVPTSTTPTTTPTGDTDSTTNTVAPTTESGPSSTSTTFPATTPSTPGPDPFTLGVASGDPDATSVVLWTRLAPDPLNGGGLTDDVDVTWEMATDNTFDSIVVAGDVIATAGHGHSVHVTAQPPAEAARGILYYRFRCGDQVSPTGATTLAPQGAVEQARFVSASCQDYQDGFYPAHRDIAEKAPDFVVWLGDYIYESGGDATVREGAARTHNAPEPMDLGAYRNRYALYKLDPNLQASHAACPWFVIWDDHEVENNYAGLTPQDPADQAAFPARRQQAYQAWWEHMPVRLDAPPTEGDYRIYRAVQWGDLVGMTLLDTRQYRSDQACGDVTFSVEPPCPETFDEDRTLTGDAQQDWLFDHVGAQGTTWNVIAQQVVMADVTLNGAVLNFDQWDGYPAARQRVLRHLADNAVPNAIVLSGDIHIAGVALLRAGERGMGQPVAVEFIDTSISSSAPVPAYAADLFVSFPDIVDVELAHRGYTLHTVTPSAWSAEYRIVDDVFDEHSPVTSYRTFVVDAGTVSVRIEPGP